MKLMPGAAVLAASLFSLPLAAQASFQTFGTGCPGAPSPKPCATSNDTASSLQSLFFSQTSEVCLEVPAPTSLTLVTGFEILTRAMRGQKITVPGRIHLADNSGAPVTAPAATGNLTVDTTTGWYRVTFAKPLVIKAKQKYFISWADTRVPFSQNVHWPVPTSGTKSVSYHRYASSGAFSRGPFNVNPWSFRVLCVGTTRETPALSNTGLPKLGTSYSLNVVKARGSSVAVLISGFSNTSWLSAKLPLSLGVLAPSCSLLVSFDLVAGAPTSGSGTATLSIPVPNNDKLVGAKLHHQWMVVDSGANMLGLSFSNGGTATIGK